VSLVDIFDQSLKLKLTDKTKRTLACC